MYYPTYGGKNSSVLGTGCEVLEMKNTQFLERGLNPSSNRLDPYV